MAPPTLDTLPTEIVLQIAGSLDGHLRNRSLCALALTARCFREVARETLMSAPCFQLRWIHLFMWQLGQHSQFIHGIRRLEITSDRSGGREKDVFNAGLAAVDGYVAVGERKELSGSSQQNWSCLVQLYCYFQDAIFEFAMLRYDVLTSHSALAFQGKDALKEKCREMIALHADSESNKADWIAALDHDAVAALMGVLLVILPNLKELHVGVSWLVDFPLFSPLTAWRNNRWFPGHWISKHFFLGAVINKLQTQLTTIDFPSDVSDFTLPTYPRKLFDFRGFGHLKELNMNIRAFWTSSPRTFSQPSKMLDATTVLPPSLEILRLSQCTETTATLAIHMCLDVQAGCFPALRRVELYYKLSLMRVKMLAKRHRCLNPVDDTRRMFKAAGTGLYLYFPAVKWSTKKFGATPWSCRNEGRLWEVESTRLGLPPDLPSSGPMEYEFDCDGDAVMRDAKGRGL